MHQYDFDVTVSDKEERQTKPPTPTQSAVTAAYICVYVIFHSLNHSRSHFESKQEFELEAEKYTKCEADLASRITPVLSQLLRYWQGPSYVLCLSTSRSLLITATMIFLGAPSRRLLCWQFLRRIADNSNIAHGLPLCAPAAPQLLIFRPTHQDRLSCSIAEVHNELPSPPDHDDEKRADSFTVIYF